jgi:hypothetical protein
MRNPFRNRLFPLIAGIVVGAAVMGGGAVVLAGESTPTYERESTITLHPGEGPGHGIKFGLRQIIAASGLDPSVFREGFAAGKSINTILSENGKDPANVQAEVLATIKAKLDEKVAAGDLTQEQAGQLYERASTALPSLMDATPPVRGEGPGLKCGHILAFSLKTAAETIGIEPGKLMEALRSGSTIADVATANGIDPQAVIDALVAEATARIDQAVADGKIDAGRAAEMKANLAGHLTNLVNGAFKGHGPMGSGPGHRFPGPGRWMGPQQHPETGSTTTATSVY